jgi:hypothetical protein
MLRKGDVVFYILKNSVSVILLPLVEGVFVTNKVSRFLSPLKFIDLTY